MKVKKVTKQTIYYLHIEGEDEGIYTRYCSDHWTFRMGESDEMVYNKHTISYLEELFQESITITKKNKP